MRLLTAISIASLVVSIAAVVFVLGQPVTGPVISKQDHLTGRIKRPVNYFPSRVDCPQDGIFVVCDHRPGSFHHRRRVVDIIVVIRNIPI